MANPNQNNDNNNKNNNFFNNNPLLAFAIFSIVVIMIFKVMVGDGGGEGLGNVLGDQQVTQNKRVTYSEIKKQIKEGNVESVKIASSTIEAIITTPNGAKTRYSASNVPALDRDLIPLLE